MTGRIALTGATGFVGNHLLNELISQGYQVNALTRRPQQPRQNVNWILGDLSNQKSIIDLIENTDALINVAGLIKAKSMDDFLSANTHAVEQLLNHANTIKKPYHFIQISTLAAREKNISEYAESKYQAELLFNDNDPSLNWTIIRPPAVYGPEDTETLKIFKTLVWRLALIPVDKKARVSWIHVADLAKAITATILNEDCYSSIIEIDDETDKGYSHEEFYSAASDLLGVSPIKVTLPKFILKTIGHVNDIFGRIFGYTPMLSAQKVNEICHPNWVVDKTPKTKISGWQAEYDLRKGLEQTLDWYKNNKYF